MSNDDLKVHLELSPDVLQRIIEIEGNQFCFDCRAPNPEWASLGFGILVWYFAISLHCHLMWPQKLIFYNRFFQKNCSLNCAGIHRSLGVHITLVRSLKMDDWSEDQLNAVLLGGNESFSSYYSTQRLCIESSIESKSAGISSKYLRPEIVYYKEVLQARVQNRAAVEYDPSMFMQLLTPSPSAPKKVIEALLIILFIAQTAINQIHNRTQAPEWMPDEDALECMICHQAFSWFFRRHHCRR